MRLDLDAKVKTRDGEDAGSLQSVVVDPRTGEITHVVVNTGPLLGHDVLLAREELDRASAGGDVIHLRLTKQELESLPAYVPGGYVAPPVNWIPPQAYDFPRGAFLWPASAAPAPPNTEFLIEKGAAVIDRDGGNIGVIDEVRFNSNDGRIESFVLRVGGVLTTLFGGGDCVEVSTDQVDSVVESNVHLKAAKHELAQSLRAR